jgi:hypothetical protein
MSLRSLATIAAERDGGTPTKTTRKTAAANEQQGEAETRKASPGDVLVAAIPTEVLALYTFATSAFVASVSTGDARLGLRWGVYVAGFVAIAAYLVNSYRRSAQTVRNVPVRELLTASVAFGAWGLVMPGSPLMAQLSSSNQQVWSVLITAAGIVLLWIVGSPLKDQAKPATRARQRRRPAASHQAK